MPPLGRLRALLAPGRATAQLVSLRDFCPPAALAQLPARGWGSAPRAAYASAPAAEAGQPQEAGPGPAVAKGWVQRPPQDPWTPTRLLAKRNFLPRRMGHLMQVLEEEAQQKALAAKTHPDFAIGDILQLKLAVPENKGKPAVVRGICIARRRRAIRSSFTLLNSIPGGGSVERSFPLHSPSIQELKVVGRSRVNVRRAKLYFLRKARGNVYAV